MDLVDDHQLWRLAVQQAQSEQLHIGAAAIDWRLNTQAFDDLGVQLVVARVGRHLKVNRFTDFHFIELIAYVGVALNKLFDNHGFANVAVAVQQHAGHAPAGWVIEQVRHSGQRLITSGVRHPLGRIQSGHAFIDRAFQVRPDPDMQMIKADCHGSVVPYFSVRRLYRLRIIYPACGSSCSAHRCGLGIFVSLRLSPYRLCFGRGTLDQGTLGSHGLEYGFLSGAL
ncbi:hypothetical protein IWX87_003569 [Polaromonas sp. CG_9.7]|nr:hypothetical protein [Polaromonas sp. CG_9.7]MBG6115768.1 hypothetical protein [Polaromonas sp. CG_9.2]MDH6186666.1 hypothetical protein [Polaromonas sp. CG_23.6]